MAVDSVLLWSDGKLQPSSGPLAGEVLAADSWWCADNFVVEKNRHLERFQQSLEQRGLTPVDLSQFLDAVSGFRLPPGEWFPRIDARAQNQTVQLSFSPRPSPPRHDHAVVMSAPGDPRTLPQYKGPDLERLGQLRTSAQEQGASEAIILTDGLVAEGAYSSVLIWSEDRKSLSPVDSTLARIPSVTESIVVEIAHEAGYAVHPGRFSPAELEGRDVWLVSALHGIRIVTSWISGPEVATTLQDRRDQFQQSWWERARPPH